MHYERESLKCSICKKDFTYKYTNQMWISLKVATDVMPLLVNSCSKECSELLPTPAKDYIQKAHKGGSGQPQFPTESQLINQKYLLDVNNPSNSKKTKVIDMTTPTKPKRFKLIRKLWEKQIHIL